MKAQWRHWNTTSDGASRPQDPESVMSSDASTMEKGSKPPEKWNMGMLNDRQTEEVPGTVLLLSSNRNEPLGLYHQQEHHSSSSMPSQQFESRRSSHVDKKKTADGQILLDPQPDDSLNDPLNWPSWRRDAALLSLGFYCMLGGGMTPILAAGFNDVARTFDVSYSRVALTTGLYMMGLGVGSVIFSPTAILFGKRPVYLVSAVMFILTSIWCAKAPNFANLATARVFQGISVSPVECLPSATIAEIYFLHERAFRVGIYTLLLLGGKNLVPLVSAAVIQSKEWRWVFYIVAIIVGFGLCLLFFFVPETFCDRTPRPKVRKPSVRRSFSSLVHHPIQHLKSHHSHPSNGDISPQIEKMMSPRQQKLHDQDTHARFEDPGNGAVPVQTLPEKAVTEEKYILPNTEGLKNPTPVVQTHQMTKDRTNDEAQETQSDKSGSSPPQAVNTELETTGSANGASMHAKPKKSKRELIASMSLPSHLNTDHLRVPSGQGFLTIPNLARHESENDSALPHLHNLNSPYYVELEKNDDYFNQHGSLMDSSSPPKAIDTEIKDEKHPQDQGLDHEQDIHDLEHTASLEPMPSPKVARYTTNLRQAPPKSYLQTLKPWNGRLRKSNWFLVALRPFILYAYPSVLWSALVYSLSVGWLIVLSESVSNIYRNKETYRFSALGTGLVYLSPFIGGILGTVVAGKVSDVIVRFMSRRNGGIYEPEFRLVMAAPVAISTAIGLMGYGWSAQERDRWIVPTIFFGIISFGCSLGSTTAITFCVDSYRQYAGEALVTLNFSKNIFHGLVFSLFFPKWLESDGPKKTFLAIGGIQIACLLTTIPMYIYGKRARMWTVRKKLLEKF